MGAPAVLWFSYQEHLDSEELKQHGVQTDATVIDIRKRERTRTGKNRYRLLAKPRTEFLQTRFIGNIYEDVTCQRILEELK